MKYFIICSFFLNFKVFALINGVELKDNIPVVSLEFKNQSFCTGIFINSRTILTAAHCLENNHPIINIRDTKFERIKYELERYISHPRYKKRLFGSIHDLGLIVLKNNISRNDFPTLYSGGKLSYDGLFYACGKTDITLNMRSCTQGENSYMLWLDQVWSFGLSCSEDNSGTEVSIAPNDSGGVIIDQKLNEIIAIMWGTQTPNFYKFCIIAPSFSTPLTDAENIEFIKRYL